MVQLLPLVAKDQCGATFWGMEKSVQVLHMLANSKLCLVAGGVVQSVAHTTACGPQDDVRDHLLHNGHSLCPAPLSADMLVVSGVVQLLSTTSSSWGAMLQILRWALAS